MSLHFASSKLHFDVNMFFMIRLKTNNRCLHNLTDISAGGLLCAQAADQRRHDAQVSPIRNYKPGFSEMPPPPLIFVHNVR